MRRLALAGALLAGTAAAAPHVQPPRPAQVRTIEAVAVAGSLQTAHAYAAPAEAKYVTEFPQVLVVRVNGLSPGRHKHGVRVSCATKGCVLAPTEQPNEGKFLDRDPDQAAYDVDVIDGVAMIRIATEADTPQQTYTIVATPAAGRGERAVSARFSLTSR